MKTRRGDVVLRVELHCETVPVSYSQMDARTLVEAMTLWEGTGTAVAQAAHAVSGLLSDHGIANLIAGGLAVQLHGYPRTTVDVDIVVADVQQAHEFLVANGYKPSLVRMMAVIDPIRRVTIDLLPANKCLKRECEVPFPEPKKPEAIMQPVGLEELISLKLDSWKHSPTRRMRDKADVTELIMRNALPRDLKVHRAIQEDYLALWDALAAEPPGPAA
jgi:hypothetical protein